MSGQNPNYPQHLNANCPRGIRTYTSTGRPFTAADLKPGCLGTEYECSDTSGCFSNADNTTQDFSRKMCNQEYSGRAFNPALDISRNRLERSQTQYQYKQPTQSRGSRLNLEYEMARNKEFALGRLRAEQAAACPRPTMRYEKPQMAATSRGREFDARSEIQRQLAQAESPNVCMKPGRVNTNEGRRVDVDKVYDYNKQTCSPAGRSGRALDLQRDLTFRRLNMPTPKQQRATSCPTPVQYSNNPPSSIQRLSRICPRSSQSVSVSPTRSIATSEATNSRYATPMQQRSTRVPGVIAKYPATPICRPVRTPVCPVEETSMDSPGTITKTVTTTTRAMTPEQTAICPTPQKSADMLTSPYNDITSRSKEQTISHITQDNMRQMDSAYGLTPPRGFAVQSPFKTPQQPLNVTEQSPSISLNKRNDSNGPSMGGNNTQMKSMHQDRSMSIKDKSVLNKTQPVPAPPPIPITDRNSANCRDLQRSYRSIDQSKRCAMPQTNDSRSFDQSTFYNNESSIMEEDYRPLPSRTCPSPMQPRSTQDCPAPTSESYYFSKFDEPTYYRKRQVEFPEQSYIDLTDETQYQYDDMDISGYELFARSACPNKPEDSKHLNSWRIPSEDLTCNERQGFDSYTSQQQPDFSSTMVQTMPQRRETLGGDFDATEYRELPSSICPPCEQPKATPQKSAGALTLPSDQTQGQVCNGMTFGINTQCNATSPNDTTTYDLRNLYATQCNDATAFALNTLFGNKTQLMDEPNSIRECANAKRCGRVQFDSSDKDQVQDPQRTALRKAEIENLVNDTYCPGIIQETIDGRENFNNYSFNISLKQDSKDASCCEASATEDPMTLLEAFSIRIEKERAEIAKDLKENATEEQIEDSIVKYFASQNPSDLNRSIKSLLLSEHLQEHEQVEKTKDSLLEAEVQKWATSLPDNAKVKLVAFTGHTKSTKGETI
ncbi:uncharacterized protein LOC135954783 isoform X2 [Calliphora vicina]|uniref:uncharacterized protein LOC135954783 isoform X2 n=1 Tax=Calliphora vicina TaxID=7373 RepID=UPI00325A91B5